MLKIRFNMTNICVFLKQNKIIMQMLAEIVLMYTTLWSYYAFSGLPIEESSTLTLIQLLGRGTISLVKIHDFFGYE
jgi:hypothetical protein